MKNPNPVNLQSSDEIWKAGWRAESRDADGHVTSYHAPISAEDTSIAEWIVECTKAGETVTFWPESPPAGSPSPLSQMLGGWIVGSGDGKRFRHWEDGNPTWTDDRTKATRYARREDAEAVHREDEDAWSIQPYSPVEALREKTAIERQVDDLATLVRVLCRELPKDHEKRAKALDYLERNFLLGSPLRGAPPAYNNCTCDCHRGSGKIHFVACCSPATATPEGGE